MPSQKPEVVKTLVDAADAFVDDDMSVVLKVVLKSFIKTIGGPEAWGSGLGDFVMDETMPVAAKTTVNGTMLKLVAKYAEDEDESTSDLITTEQIQAKLKQLGNGG